MARTFAQVQVSIWDDPDFIALDADAQRLYFVLMTRADLSMAGVIDWHPGRFAELAADTTADHISDAAGKLCRAGFVVIDDTTKECLLRTQVRHDGCLKRGPRTAAGVVSAWREIYSRRLKSVVAAEAAKVEVTDSVLNVISPLHEWNIKSPIRSNPDRAIDTPSDTPSDTATDTSTGQPATSNQQPANNHRDADASLFEHWWLIYPRKVGKGQARKAYTSALKKTSADQLAEACTAFAAQLHDSRTEARFIPHPATWLNGERWTDTPPPDNNTGPRVVTASNGVTYEVTW